MKIANLLNIHFDDIIKIESLHKFRLIPICVDIQMLRIINAVRDNETFAGGRRILYHGRNIEIN